MVPAGILHVDSDGNYINQWFGNEVGPGKFNSAHGLAVDPVNGDRHHNLYAGDTSVGRITRMVAPGR